MAELASTVLVKSSLQAVLLLDEDRPNESKVFFASMARKTMEVVVTLPTILVEGRIHTKSATDLQAYLSLEAGSFFPVTAAKVRGQICARATCWKARWSWSTKTGSRRFPPPPSRTAASGPRAATNPAQSV